MTAEGVKIDYRLSIVGGGLRVYLCLSFDMLMQGLCSFRPFPSARKNNTSKYQGNLPEKDLMRGKGS